MWQDGYRAVREEASLVWRHGTLAACLLPSAQGKNKSNLTDLQSLHLPGPSSNSLSDEPTLGPGHQNPFWLEVVSLKALPTFFVNKSSEQLTLFPHFVPHTGSLYHALLPFHSAEWTSDPHIPTIVRWGSFILRNTNKKETTYQSHIPTIQFKNGVKLWELGRVVHACYFLESVWKAKAGGSRVRGQPGATWTVPSQPSIGYLMRFCLIKTKLKKKKK
jgi:hypothetical protein